MTSFANCVGSLCLKPTSGGLAVSVVTDYLLMLSREPNVFPLVLILSMEPGASLSISLQRAMPSLWFRAHIVCHRVRKACQTASGLKLATFINEFVERKQDIVSEFLELLALYGTYIGLELNGRDMFSIFT